MKRGKFEVVRNADISTNIKASTPKPVHNRQEAKELLWMSFMLHQGHAWRDSEDNSERDAWGKHDDAIMKARIVLEWNPCYPDLLKLIADDLSWHANAVLFCMGDKERVDQYTKRSEDLAQFVSNQEAAESWTA